jgi:putative ABC transport system permease protein
MGRLRFLSTFWLDLFRRKQLARDLDEEIRAHVDIDIRERIANGTPSEEARTLATREVRSIDLVKENTRDIWTWTWLEELLRDVRYALRAMGKNTSTTCIALLIVALGIGSTTAMFSVVNAALLTPLNFKDSGRVVAIWESNPVRGFDTFAVSPGEFSEWRRQNSSFESMAAYQQRSVTLSGSLDAEPVKAAYVSGDFFDVVETPAHIGGTFSHKDADQHTSSVVLSHELWASRFGGDAAVLGRSVVLDGNNYSVVGIMPKDFGYPTGVAVWVPLPPLGDSRGKHVLTVIARLKPDVTASAAGDEMKAIATRREDDDDTHEGWTTVVSYLKEDAVKELGGTLLVLFGSVGFVLLIGCANIAGLMLSVGMKRQRELAIRSALGAGRIRMLRQLLTEDIVLSLIGGTLGIGMAYGLLHVLLAVAPGNLPRVHESEINWAVLAFAITLSVATGAIFGILPGLQLLRANTNDQLKASIQSASEGVNSHRWRSLLVVSQIALTVVVTSGAGLMIQSLRNLYRVDPGFNSENVVTLQLNLPEQPYNNPERTVALMERLLDGFHGLPGVLQAASTNALPLSRPAMDEAPPLVGFFVEGPVPERHAAQARFITPGYFKTLRIPITRGRDFGPHDRQNSPRVVIVNQSLVQRAFHGQIPIGERMQIGGIRHEIIGTVPDTRDDDLRLQPGPMYFLPLLQQSSNVNTLTSSVRFVVRVSQAANVGALTGAMRNEIKAVDSRLAVFGVHTMKDIRRLSVSRTTFTAAVLVFFSSVGLLLAAVGLYGIISNSVSQRTGEFGIRIALGAEPRDVLRSVMRQMIPLCALGTALGLFGSLAFSRLMNGLVFEVSPYDPITLGSSALVLLMAATAASLIPAIRATRINPISCLRHE